MQSEVKGAIRQSNWVAISFFGRPALGDSSDHKARQPLKFVVAFAALQANKSS